MEVTEFLVLASQLDGMEDDLLVGPLFLLDYPDVVGLSPGRSTRLCVVEQLCYSVLRSSLASIRLRASATLLSEPLRYLMVML